MKKKGLNIRYNIPYGKKGQLYFEDNYSIGRFSIHMRIYLVPKDEWHPEGVKYSLVLVHGKERLLCFDNHERKGHHVHIEGTEHPHRFSDIKTLVSDFKVEAKKIVDEKDED